MYFQRMHLSLTIKFIVVDLVISLDCPLSCDFVSLVVFYLSLTHSNNARLIIIKYRDTYDQMHRNTQQLYVKMFISILRLLSSTIEKFINFLSPLLYYVLS